MTRYLFRAFWRRLYGNPEYLKYSGTWDTTEQGRPARSLDIKHWVDAFRDEWFTYTHPDIDT